MKGSMVIIENEETVPQSIRNWAESREVPIIKGNCLSIHSDTEYKYEYVIEYSSDISSRILEYYYRHSKNLPAVISVTERLVIKEIGPEDLNFYKNLIEKFPDAVSDKTLLGLSMEDFAERHLAYMKYSYQLLGYGIWGINLKKPGQSLTDYTDLCSDNIRDGKNPLIGIAGLDGAEVPSLSYALSEEYRGKGYALEACKCILGYAVGTLGLEEVRIEIKKANKRSLRLAEKLAADFPKLVNIAAV